MEVWTKEAPASKKNTQGKGAPGSESWTGSPLVNLAAGPEKKMDTSTSCHKNDLFDLICK
jgi:hypothetical protein